MAIKSPIEKPKDIFAFLCFLAARAQASIDFEATPLRELIIRWQRGAFAGLYAVFPTARVLGNIAGSRSGGGWGAVSLPVWLYQ